MKLSFKKMQIEQLIISIQKRPKMFVKKELIISTICFLGIVVQIINYQRMIWIKDFVFGLTSGL